METDRDILWRNRLLEVRSLARTAAAPAFYTALDRGAAIRICPGVTLPADTWRTLDHDARFRALIHATALRFADAGPFSHLSAAALWGLPIIGPWPGRVETLIDRASRGRSRRGIVRHAHGVPGDAIDIDGLLVTDLARTVVDAASILPFTSGVVMADFALRASRVAESWMFGQLDGRQLIDEARGPRSPRGRARAIDVASFADPASGSPGESDSRGIMHALGFDPPELQQPFWDADGLIGYSDFWWRELGLVGEFDGFAKYTQPQFLKGRTPSQVVIEEKIREDRIRALGLRIVRWVWSDIQQPQRLALLLDRAGVGRRRRFSRSPS